MLLAIDPGMNSPGVALFAPLGLISAARVPIPARFADLPDGARWAHVAHVIVEWIEADRKVPRGYLGIHDVIFEKPQWYTREKSKGDPNKLAGVLGVAANLTGILSALLPLAIHTPTPAEWVGQLSKVCHVCKVCPGKKKCPECRGSAWETQRGRRIRSRLTEAELALVPDQNDAIDAVGLGLWQLGRLTPRSVFSNGHDGR